MRLVADHFADAAMRAKKAGFDMVMLHGGHGWLLSQFISPVANLRTDEFGGSIANRARFPIMVCRRIKQECGQDFPIEYRFSATDLVPGGLELEEAIEFAKIMDAEVDAFQVSSGMISEPSTYPYTLCADYLEYGENAERTAEIKRAVTKPVAVVGAIPHLEFGGQLVADGKADIVAMCRALIADPALPAKTAEGPVAGHTGPASAATSARCGWARCFPCRCSVNPVAGQEEYYRCYPLPRRKKKVVVVGGGPAGMQAAVTAASQGHSVVLFEAQDRLGGNLNAFAQLPFKLDAKRFLEYLTKQVSRLRCRRAAEDGGRRGRRQGRGPGRAGHRRGGRTGLAGDTGSGRQASGMGGRCQQWQGLDGSECRDPGWRGDRLRDRAVPRPARKAGDHRGDAAGSLPARSIPCNRTMLLEFLGKENVDMKTGTRVEAVKDGAVIVVGPDGKDYEIVADTLVNALGARPRTAVADALKGLAPEVHVVGDCVKPRIIYDAIHESFDAAMAM